MPAAAPAPVAAGEAVTAEPALPVARVAVDVPLAHLDRPFDYRVPLDLDAAAPDTADPRTVLDLRTPDRTHLRTD